MNFGIILAEIMDYIDSKNSHGKNELQAEIRRIMIAEAIRIKEGE